MDPVDVVALTRALVDLDSTTGREAPVVDYLAAWFRRAGYQVVEQPVGDGRRRNLLATIDPPRVVLSTHVDCVPPFFPSRLEGGRLYGRGACDAKGAVAAQIAAVERLRLEGERRVGLLFVVGEERGSDGARAAATLASGSHFIVTGEPTENRLAAATRGVLRVRLTARGRAAHSSTPEGGESAIEKLLDVLVALRRGAWPVDPVLGRTSYTVASVSGGVAPNVVPPSAEAEVTFRTVGALDELRAELCRLATGVKIEEVIDVPPARFEPVPGFETAVFSFATDAPFLAPWGQAFLVGPGSARLAHADAEHVEVAQLLEAAEIYRRLARTLLARPAPAKPSEPAPRRRRRAHSDRA